MLRNTYKKKSGSESKTNQLYLAQTQLSYKYQLWSQQTDKQRGTRTS